MECGIDILMLRGAGWWGGSCQNVTPWGCQPLWQLWWGGVYENGKRKAICLRPVATKYLSWQVCVTTSSTTSIVSRVEIERLVKCYQVNQLSKHKYINVAHVHQHRSVPVTTMRYELHPLRYVTFYEYIKRRVVWFETLLLKV